MIIVSFYWTLFPFFVKPHLCSYSLDKPCNHKKTSNISNGFTECLKQDIFILKKLQLSVTRKCKISLEYSCETYGYYSWNKPCSPIKKHITRLLIKCLQTKSCLSNIWRTSYLSNISRTHFQILNWRRQ